MWRLELGMLRRITFLLATVFAVTFTVPAFADDYESGVASYRSGKYQEAFDLLLRALDKNPNNADAYYVMALTCQQMGKYVEARSYYQFIVDHFPKSKAFPLASKAAKGLAHVRAPVQPAPVKVNEPKVTVHGRPVVAAVADKDEIPDEERVPYTKSHGDVLYVQGVVNGKPIQMLVDTGAFKTCFGKNHLKALGIKIPEGPSAGHFRGANGQSHEYWETSVTIALGRIKVNTPIAVMSEMNEEPIIGQSFLQKVQYSIDRSASYLCFYNSQAKKPKNVGLSTDAYVVPFRWVDNKMIVEGKVNDIDIEMQIDTGASSCVFSSYLARRLGRLRAVSDVSLVASQSVGGGISINYEFEIDTLEVGPIRKHHVVVWVSDNALPYPLIGQSFFGAGKFVVDNEQKVIRFQR